MRQQDQGRIRANFLIQPDQADTDTDTQACFIGLIGLTCRPVWKVDAISHVCTPTMLTCGKRYNF
jgi:hypothetical protein